MGLFRRNKSDQFINEAVDQAREASLSQGGLLATFISAFALLFSGYSFYETVVRSADLAIYVPPRMAYTDPNSPEHPLEVFVIPLTLANDGARTGTVLSIDLAVTNPRTNKTKLFYAAHLGPWGYAPQKPFMPIALSGKTSYSRSIQFIPRAGEKISRILDLEPGDYRFEMRLNTATPDNALPFLKAKIHPLRFTMQSGKMDYRRFNKTGTQAMWSKNLRPAKTGAQ
jgi:hypothetical protein